MLTQNQFNEYYQALITRDSQYVGIFFVGVKSTGICCIATCSAKKPKKENVEFFSHLSDALKSGYRPCKICCPTENAFNMPPEVKRAFLIVKESPKQKISDFDLSQQQISPHVVRRWCKQNLGITYHSYQRMYRINNAYNEMRSGLSTTQAAFNQGYNTLSGFGYTYKKMMKKSPKNSHNQPLILLHRLQSPLGPMIVGASDSGICLLEFSDRKMLETEFKDLQKRLNAPIIVGENTFTHQVKKELNEYFEGKRKTFEVPLHTPGTPFQCKVWDVIKTLPYGTTISYLRQAQMIGAPKAVRAVANANGQNRIAIIIPCHRIIGANGQLTGYGGGLARKKWLLDFEKKHNT